MRHLQVLTPRQFYQPISDTHATPEHSIELHQTPFPHTLLHIAILNWTLPQRCSLLQPRSAKPPSFHPFHRFHSMFRQLDPSVWTTIHRISFTNNTLSLAIDASLIRSLHKSVNHWIPKSPAVFTISAYNPFLIFLRPVTDTPVCQWRVTDRPVTQWRVCQWPVTEWSVTQWWVTEWSVCQWRVTEWPVCQGRVSQWRVCQWPVTEWSVTQWWVTEWLVCQWRVTEWPVCQGRVCQWPVTDRPITQWWVTEWSVCQWRVTEWPVCQGRVSQWRVTEWRVSQWPVTDWPVTDWRLTDSNVRLVTHLTGKLTIVGFFSRMKVVLLNLCKRTTVYHVTTDKI